MSRVLGGCVSTLLSQMGWGGFGCHLAKSQKFVSDFFLWVGVSVMPWVKSEKFVAERLWRNFFAKKNPRRSGGFLVRASRLLPFGFRFSFVGSKLRLLEPVLPRPFQGLHQE